MMGVNNMNTLKTRLLLVLLTLALLAFISNSALAAAASFSKSVTALEGGNYLIKLKVRATAANIYALRLVDPQSSIIDVYAPKGWCAVTDGEDYLAMTASKPIGTGKTLEFIIHSTSDKVNYTWSVHDLLKQIGETGTM